MTASVELTNSRLVAFAGQQPAQRLEHVGLVVGDEHARGRVSAGFEDGIRKSVNSSCMRDVCRTQDRVPCADATVKR